MHSPRYNPLRRGSVLPLGVEAHLKIKVTPDLYTSPLPSYPRLVHTEPRHRSDHSEQASDVCCAFPRRSSRLGKRRCRLGSRRASTAPTLCTLAPQAVKTTVRAPPALSFVHMRVPVSTQLSPIFPTTILLRAGASIPGQEAGGNPAGAAGLPSFCCALRAWLVCGRARPVRDQDTVP